MSQPEISRRCLQCGASVRGEGSFCPQCRTTMINHSSATAVSDASRETWVDDGSGMGSTPGEGAAVPRQQVIASPSSNPAETMASPPVAQSGEVVERPMTAPDSFTPLDSSRQPSSPPSRRVVGVVENKLRPRVEKMRDASVNMLDEASEDSGWRFILIAVAIFLLFLFFLLLSKRFM